MRYYSEIIDLAVSHCRYLESKIKQHPEYNKKSIIGTSLQKVNQTFKDMPYIQLKEWLAELEEWKSALSIKGITRYNKTRGIEAVISCLKTTIRNKMIYDILENN